MGKHSSGRRTRAGDGFSMRRVGECVLGILVTLAAWCALVYYAIQFGPDARSGRTIAWVLLGVATLGAIACLFLSMILSGRLLHLFRARPAAVPSRHSRR